MKRKTMHIGFSALSLCLAALAIIQWLEIEKAREVSDAVRQIPASLTASVDAPTTDEYPETRLARANALSNGEDFDAAELAFNDLIRQYPLSTIGRAAQFNLANAYLRQGMVEEQPSSRKRSMLELAKQRYRDLLRATPNDWDARYNLERALRLAPENADTLAEKIKAIKSVNVIVPDFKMKDLP